MDAKRSSGHHAILAGFCALLTRQALDAEAQKNASFRKVFDASEAFRAQQRAWKQVTEKPYREAFDRVAGGRHMCRI